MTTDHDNDPVPDPDAEATERRATARRWRTVAAGFTGVVSVLGMMLGLLGFWTLRTASDSERFEDRVTVLLQREEVSNALAQRTVNEIAAAIDLRAAIDETLPDALKPGADLLLAGVRSRVEDRLAELIRDPAVAERIGAAAGRAHSTAVLVIEGREVDGVDITDGEVRVNLLPLMVRAMGASQEVGLFRDLELPDLDRGGDPDEQRAELEAALGRDLPDDFGTPVVYRSDSLDQAGSTLQLVRDVLVLARRTFWILILIGLGLAALAIWLSGKRWRAATWIVAGLFAITLLVRIVMNTAVGRLPDVVAGPGAKATVAEIADGLRDSLNDTLTVYALIALAAVCLAGFVHFGMPLVRARSTSSTDA